MKKIMLNILFALITTLGYSQVPNYVPTNGLVGWWPFNGNANDESGNGNNGTVNGATLTSDRFGNINQAYGFDGNDWIEMNIPQTIEFSVSVWFNSSILNQSYMGIVQHKDNCIRGAGYIVELYNNSIRELASNCGQCNNICPNYFNFDNIMTTGIDQWYHLVLTCDLNGTYKLYLNNNLIHTTTNLSTLCQFNVPFSVGKHHDGAQDLYYFNGDIDDIGSWNRPISDCEIQDLYHSQLGFTTIDAGPNQTICKDDSVTLNGSGGIFLSWNNGVIDAFPFAPLQTDSYVLTGADTLGCVGTDTVNITVLNPTTSTQTQTALDTYTWPLNNQTYTQGGTYTATIPNAAGCDSVVTLNLTFNYTGINEPIGSAVSISPNPTRSKITVKSSLTLIGEKFTIYDQQGKAVKMGVITAEETEIDLSNLSEGVYLFKAGTDMQETFKIIKQ
jgi:hypothetical protein